MLSREIIETSDGSSTIFIPELQETYHSKNGSISETYHVFIQNGLNHFLSNIETINILEFGFGTGLNALITYLETIESGKKINYVSLEKYPLEEEEFTKLNFPEKLAEKYKKMNKNEIKKLYWKMIKSKWNEAIEMDENFTLTKISCDFFEFNYLNDTHDLIYFDAFGARVQPDLWTENLFEKIYHSMKTNGILTTYSSKGSARRALQNVGFRVEKRPGPLGKREMIIAIK